MNIEKVSALLERGDAGLIRYNSAAVRLFDEKSQGWFFGRFKSLEYNETHGWRLRMPPFFNVTPRGITDPLDPGVSIFGHFPGIIVHERRGDNQAFALGPKG